MRTWKKVLSFGLAVIMAVGMCGCGRKGSETDNVKQQSASPELAKQYVYRMNAFDFTKLQTGDGEMTVQGFQKVQSKLYAVLQNYKYSEDGTSAIEFLLAVIDPGTLAMETITLEAPSQEETAEAAVKPETERMTRYENSYYSNYQISGSGYIYGLKSTDISDYSDPENYVNEHKDSVCCWNLKGEFQWEAVLDALNAQESWYYVNALIGQKDGSVVVLTSGDEYGVVKVDKDGTAGEKKSVGKLQEILQNYAGLGFAEDGRLVVTYYDAGWQNMYINTYDFAADKLGEAVKLPSSFANSVSGRFSVDQAGDLIYSTSSGVYQYHIGDETEKQIMSYVNSDLYITGFDAVLPLDDTSFAAIYGEYNETDYTRSIKGGVFQKVDAGDIPDKKVLVLGGVNLFGDIQKRVVDYNKTNSEYRIVIRDYSQYNTYDDYTACYVQLNQDIVSGQMPDILMVDAYNFSVETYANKGLLADIGALIKKDDELSKIDYLENVFEACKYNGKLYEVIPTFTVEGYIGKKSLVGDKTSWTMEEAMQLVDRMTDGTAIFSDMTRSQFINTMMTICGTQFVNADSGKCNFDTDQFRTYMKYAKSLPEDLGDDRYSDSWYRFYENQFRNDRTILCGCYISDISQLVYEINGKFGEDVSYIGFPGAEKGETGAVINTGTSYVLASRSPDLDAAWQFVRYYLTDEYQDSINYQLPVKKAALQKNAEKAMKKPTYTVDGKEVEEEYRYWINDEMIEIQPLSQAQTDQVVNYISTLNRRAYYNAAVTSIINEELGAFYKNQKSGEDVSALIQNRVQLYLNENR